MNDEQHLFGLPGAENMHDDLATVYDLWVDDSLGSPDRDDTVTIEEWTVVPATGHLPHVDLVLDYVVEWIAENGELDENGAKAYENAATHEDVTIAFATALDLLASKVGYRMAGEMVATHDITHDADGEPLLNGEPLYPKVQP